eukprot:1153702-Pelagomonas_calceolata.AAC.2
MTGAPGPKDLVHLAQAALEQATLKSKVWCRNIAQSALEQAMLKSKLKRCGRGKVQRAEVWSGKVQIWCGNAMQAAVERATLKSEVIALHDLLPRPVRGLSCPATLCPCSAVGHLCSCPYWACVQACTLSRPLSRRLGPPCRRAHGQVGIVVLHAQPFAAPLLCHGVHQPESLAGALVQHAAAVAWHQHS